MEQIKSIMIVDDKLIPVESTGATTVSGNPVTISRVGEAEGILGKIQSLFRNPERKAQKELKYHLMLIKKDPENILSLYGLGRCVILLISTLVRTS